MDNVTFIGLGFFLAVLCLGGTKKKLRDREKYIYIFTLVYSKESV